MTCLANEDVRDDIFEAITSIFGFSILDFSQIELGYMNLKWKVKTDIGDLFVKQYNKTRYPDQMLQRLETSLIHQSTLYNKGIPCPKLYSYKEKYILQSSNCERFVWKEPEWVRAVNIQNSSPLKRFGEENICIGNNWGNLEGIFSNIR